MAATKKTETPFNVDTFMGMFKTPKVDYQALLDSQRKNVEAMMEANRIALDGYKSAAEKHADLLKTTVTDMQDVAGKAFDGSTPEINATKQLEAAQTLFKSALDVSREAAELTFAAHQKAFSVLQDRMTAGAEEAKTLTATS